MAFEVPALTPCVVLAPEFEYAYGLSHFADGHAVFYAGHAYEKRCAAKFTTVRQVPHGSLVMAESEHGWRWVTVMHSGRPERFELLELDEMALGDNEAALDDAAMRFWLLEID